MAKNSTPPKSLKGPSNTISVDGEENPRSNPIIVYNHEIPLSFWPFNRPVRRGLVFGVM